MVDSSRGHSLGFVPQKDFRKRYNSLGLDPDNLIGKPVYKDGKFTHVKGLGWVIPEYNRAQISMNLTNYKISSIHEIYDAACEEAEIGFA